MATTVGDERKTSTIYNLPIGFYFLKGAGRDGIQVQFDEAL